MYTVQVIPSFWEKKECWAEKLLNNKNSLMLMVNFFWEKL